MQPKSKSRAVLLSLYTVLSFSITSALLNIFLPYWLSGDIHTIVANPESLAQPGSLLVLIIFLVSLLGIMVALGAFWLYRFFGSAHFAERAPLRWALFGALFALFLKLPEWGLPDKWGILRAILQFAGLFIAYFLARVIVPLKRTS